MPTPGWTVFSWTPSRLRNHADAQLERASHFWLQSPIFSRLCYHILRRTYGQIPTTAGEEPPRPRPPLMKIYEGNVFTMNVEKMRFILSRRCYSQVVEEPLAERTTSAQCLLMYGLSSRLAVNSRSSCLSNREETAARTYQRAAFVRLRLVKNDVTWPNPAKSAHVPRCEPRRRLVLLSVFSSSVSCAGGTLGREAEKRSRVMFPSRRAQWPQSELRSSVGTRSLTCRAALPRCPLTLVFVCGGCTAFPPALFG